MSGPRFAIASVVHRPGRAVLIGVIALLLQFAIQTAMLLVIIASFSIGAPPSWFHFVTSSTRESHRVLEPGAVLAISASAWLITRYSRLPALSVSLAMALGSTAVGAFTMVLAALQPGTIAISQSPVVNIQRMLLMLTLTTAGAVLAAATPRRPNSRAVGLLASFPAAIWKAGHWIAVHRDYAGQPKTQEPREP